MLPLTQPVRPFEPDVEGFLTGTEFSNSLRVRPVLAAAGIPGRIEYLESLARGGNVLHIGCTDHLSLIEGKIAAGTWLHGRLSAVARRCLGVDIDAAALAFVRERLGYTDTMVHDILSDLPRPEILETTWDHAILGELVEHLDDPVGFLRTLHQKYGQCIARLVITVPNAFELTNVRALWRGLELVNSDHRFWFSPYTIAKVAVRAGWRPAALELCQSYLPAGRMARALLARFPFLRESIVLTALP